MQAWLALTAAAALLLAGCAAPGSGGQERSLAFERIEGCQSERGSELYEAITSQPRWEQVWRESCAMVVAGEGSQSPEPPPVDFAQQSVMVAFWGQRSTGGFGIRVTGVTERAHDVLVQVERATPAPDCAVIDAITFPADIVASERATKAAKFEFRDVTVAC